MNDNRMVMQVRVARHTNRLDQIVAFYRDQLGLPVIGGFQGHEGYDGVFIELPGTAAHLEFTSGGEHEPPRPHPESVLVLYLDSEEQIDAISRRLQKPAVVPVNPYWQRNAVAYEDPDGFQVLLTLRPGTDTTPAAQA